MILSHHPYSGTQFSVESWEYTFLHVIVYLPQGVMTSIVIEKIHLMSVKIFVSYPFLLSSSLSFSCFDNCALSCRSCPSSLALDVSYLLKLCDGKNSLRRSLSLIKSIIVFDRKNPHYVCY